ncbi:MAG: hypothetical protein ACJ76I_06655 [Gaiellaceae bacterium]
MILWNYVQWQLPGGMAAVNALGVLRIATFIVGVSYVTALALPRRRMSPLIHAALVTAPALLVIGVPSFAIDLARFGPQEPLAIGGMALGGGLLGSSVRRTTRGAGLASVVPLAALGYLFWLVGVYQKETSVCALAAVPFLAPMALSKWRACAASPRRQIVAGIVIAAVLPVLHVLYHVVRIVESDQPKYGTQTTGGSGTGVAIVDTLANLTNSLGSRIGLIVGVAALATVIASLARRRTDMVAIALVAVAAANLEMGAETGVFQSRYYLATFVLLAIVCVRGIASRSPRTIKQIGVLFALLVLLSLGPARTYVQQWATADQQGVELANAVKALRHQGCDVDVSRLDIERSDAIDALAKTEIGSCGRRRYVVAQIGHGPAGCGAVVDVWRVASYPEPVALLRCRKDHEMP